jgi:hypothetical protein
MFQVSLPFPMLNSSREPTTGLDGQSHASLSVIQSLTLTQLLSWEPDRGFYGNLALARVPDL